MRNQYKAYLFSFFSLVALLFGLLGTHAVFAKAHTQLVSPQMATTLSSRSWRIVPSPNVGSSSNFLSGVAVVSASDVWAVGEAFGGRFGSVTLIEQWNGTSWSVVPSPNVNSSGSLSGVAALSASDVWAVGQYYTTSGYFQTLTLHWNGTSWSVVASPNVGSYTNFLSGVAVVSASDVWAVGSYYNNTIGARQTLTLHWDGMSWSVVASPNVGSSDNELLGVAVVSTSDVWAVGDYYYPGIGLNQTLTLHWNGTSWSVVASPNVGSSSNELLGVAVVSTSDVWAVGSSGNSSATHQALIEQWNGTSWNVVPSPNVNSNGSLYGVAALSASDVWAVGQYYTTSGARQPLIEQWNGTSWNVVPSPNVGSRGGLLNSVAALSASDVWAVGDHWSYSTSSFRTLIDCYC